MSENLGLGKLITGPAARDAIHIAVEPVEAGEEISPGERVVVKRSPRGSKTAFTAFRTVGCGVGRADPWLEWRIQKGEVFWLWLNPGSTTSLRHVWTAVGFEASLPEGKDE